jgi:selenocysteine lyase/cysteine desulfurase
VNAGPEEVFFTHSTTDGMNVFAHGIDWRPGDEVLIAKHEHPGGYEAYQTIEKRNGIKIVWLDLPAPLHNRIRSRTRIDALLQYARRGRSPGSGRAKNCSECVEQNNRNRRASYADLK